MTTSANPTPSFAQLTPEQRKLIEHAIPMVGRVAHYHARLWRGRVRADDLMGAGHVGIVKAALKFQPERGVPFEAYAFHHVRGEIIDEIARLTRTPDKALARMGRAHAAASELRAEHEETSLDDMMSAADTDPRAQVIGVLRSQAAGMLLAALVQPIDPPPTPGEVYAANEARGRLQATLESLPERQRACVKAIFFEELTLGETASRLGVTSKTVQRDIESAKATFARALED